MRLETDLRTCSLRSPVSSVQPWRLALSMNRVLLILATVFVLHLVSCSKEPLLPLPSAIGPSPSGFRGSFNAGGVTYRFRDTASSYSNLFGLVSLQDSQGTTLLIVDSRCYGQILEDGTVLLWREAGEKATSRVIFDSFSLAGLRPVTDPLAFAAQMRKEKMSISPLPKSEHWEISPYMKAGKHHISIPYDWSRFNETLVLADHEDFTVHHKMARAIFTFSWAQRQVEVFPQEWFNTGDYDFGYQWIAHVVRRKDGAIIGEGIRLGSFELDESNRRVKKWLAQDPFLATR
jgi:hypothetical protein